MSITNLVIPPSVNGKDALKFLNFLPPVPKIELSFVFSQEITLHDIYQ